MHCVERQRGAAVIVAMITVLIGASVAASVIASLDRSIDSVTGHQDQAQARLLARAAVDWARNVLADDRMRTAVDHPNEPWSVRIPPTPVGEAEVSGEIQDWSGRFNVNDLAPGGKPNPQTASEFKRLLTALGVDPVEAAALTSRLSGWISFDPQTPSSTPVFAPEGPERMRRPLMDVSELAAIPGFTSELVSRLATVAVAVPAPTRVNVNTAPAEVIFAITSDLDLNGARVLVAERERAWFRDVADFSLRLPAGAEASEPGRLDVRSRHFLVTGRSRYGVAVVRMEVLLDRNDIWPNILWQRIL